MSYLTSSAEPLPIKLAALGPESPVVFLLKPVSAADFERLGYELFRYNIVQVSQESFRATLIDEIFNVYGDDQGEPLADMMDAYWQAMDLYSERANEWQLQEEQRLLDEALGAPKRPHTPVPEYTMKIRERSKAQLFAEEVRGRSRRLRDLTIEMQTYDQRQREGLARLIVVGWRGLKAPFAIEDGIVTEASWKALKAELPQDAVQELYRMVYAGGTVTDTEKGNSDSPLDTGSPPNGSPEQSGVSEANGGSSTTSSTGLPPPDASAATIGQSSNFTSGSAGVTVTGVLSPTGEATVISQSA